jgi:hypothetical protein
MLLERDASRSTTCRKDARITADSPFRRQRSRTLPESLRPGHYHDMIWGMTPSRAGAAAARRWSYSLLAVRVMKTSPIPHTYSDPNARLLASVIPPPPIPWQIRVWRELVHETKSWRWTRWLRAREPWQRGLFAGAASAALVLGLYQSGASSATSDDAESDAPEAPRTASLALAGARAPDARGLGARAPSTPQVERVTAPAPAVAPVKQPPTEVATSVAPAEEATLTLQDAEPAAARHARAAKRSASHKSKATKSRSSRRSAKAARAAKASKVAKASKRRPSAKPSGDSEDRVRALLSGRSTSRRARTSSL